MKVEQDVEAWWAGTSAQARAYYRDAVTVIKYFRPDHLLTFRGATTANSESVEEMAERVAPGIGLLRPEVWWVGLTAEQKGFVRDLAGLLTQLREDTIVEVRKTGDKVTLELGLLFKHPVGGRAGVN